MVDVQSDAGGYAGHYEILVLLKSQESCLRLSAEDGKLQVTRHPCLVGPLDDPPSTGVASPSSPFIFRVARLGLDHLVSASSLLCITYVVLYDQPHSAVHVMH